MRILIMVHNLTGGGAERAAALWAKGFVDRGHTVGMILNCKKNTPVTYEVPENVKIYNVYNFLASRIQIKFGINYFHIYKVRAIINEFNPDVAIGVMQPWAEIARKATIGGNTIIIHTDHSTLDLPEYAPKAKKKRLKYRYSHNNNYPITVLTNADKEWVKGIFKNVSVLPNPIAFEPVNDIPQKDNIILAAGRLDGWHTKGFDLLIKAWGAIAKDYPDWKLQIAGKGKSKSREYLQSIADDYNLNSQIEFLGYKDDMAPIYQRSSIFVLSSRYEGFGMVLIEAMSQGCAPIACNYKGRQREIITSENEGIICPVDDEQSISIAIRKMIENKSYRVLTQQNAIERSKNYNLDNIMERWTTILKANIK